MVSREAKIAEISPTEHVLVDEVYGEIEGELAPTDTSASDDEPKLEGFGLLENDY